MKVYEKILIELIRFSHLPHTSNTDDAFAMKITAKFCSKLLFPF